MDGRTDGRMDGWIDRCVMCIYIYRYTMIYICIYCTHFLDIAHRGKSFATRNADAEGARKVLPKSLAALPRRKHPVVVSKAAILEYQMLETDGFVDIVFLWENHGKP